MLDKETIDINKMHTSPTENNINELQSKGFNLVDPIKFTDYFYDSFSSYLTRNQCWLRKRYNPEKNECIWTFQKTIGEDTDLGHSYNEIEGTFEEIKQEIEKTIKINEIDLESSFASYLTFRYNISEGMYLDHCFFDIDGNSQYWVITRHLEKNSKNDLPDNIVVSSKIAEFIRLYKPTLVKYGKCSIDRIKNYFDFCSENLSEVPPTSQELRSVNQQYYDISKECDKYLETTEKIKSEVFEEWKNTRRERYVLVVQKNENVNDTKSNDIIFVSSNEIGEKIISLQNKSVSFYVIDLKEDSQDDVLCYTCESRYDSKGQERIYADLTVSKDENKIKMLPFIVDTGNPFDLCLQRKTAIYFFGNGAYIPENDLKLIFHHIGINEDNEDYINNSGEPTVNCMVDVRKPKYKSFECKFNVS